MVKPLLDKINTAQVVLLAEEQTLEISVIQLEVNIAIQQQPVANQMKCLTQRGSANASQELKEKICSVKIVISSSIRLLT